MRDQYGRHTFGQSLLLARRLVEAGSRVVQVNWPAVANGNPTVDAFAADLRRDGEAVGHRGVSAARGAHFSARPSDAP